MTEMIRQIEHQRDTNIVGENIVGLLHQVSRFGQSATPLVDLLEDVVATMRAELPFPATDRRDLIYMLRNALDRLGIHAPVPQPRPTPDDRQNVQWLLQRATYAAQRARDQDRYGPSDSQAERPIRQFRGIGDFAAGQLVRPSAVPSNPDPLNDQINDYADAMLAALASAQLGTSLGLTAVTTAENPAPVENGEAKTSGAPADLPPRKPPLRRLHDTSDT